MLKTEMEKSFTKGLSLGLLAVEKIFPCSYTGSAVGLEWRWWISQAIFKCAIKIKYYITLTNMEYIVTKSHFGLKSVTSCWNILSKPLHLTSWALLFTPSCLWNDWYSHVEICICSHSTLSVLVPFSFWHLKQN